MVTADGLVPRKVPESGGVARGADGWPAALRPRPAWAALPAVPAPALSQRQTSGPRDVPSPSRNVLGGSRERRSSGRGGASRPFRLQGERSSPAPNGLRKEEDRRRKTRSPEVGSSVVDVSACHQRPCGAPALCVPLRWVVRPRGGRVGAPAAGLARASEGDWLFVCDGRAEDLQGYGVIPLIDLSFDDLF